MARGSQQSMEYKHLIPLAARFSNHLVAERGRVRLALGRRELLQRPALLLDELQRRPRLGRLPLRGISPRRLAERLAVGGLAVGLHASYTCQSAFRENSCLHTEM